MRDDRTTEESELGARGGAVPEVLCRVVGGEALLLDTASGHYFSLDPIGTEIWQQLTDGRGVDEIAADVAERHGAEVSRVRRDVLDLIDELRQAGLWRLTR